MANLFKTESGKKEIFDLYDQKLASLNIGYKYRMVDTSFGTTNIITAGSPTQPPLIIVHGSNACAPIALETYPNLAKQFYVFAVDVPAQPNKSEETRMSIKDDSYGKWMDEVMTALGLREVTLAGFSLGGLVILKTLQYNEDRVKEVFLASPAYIVNGSPLKALFKVFIPMRLYMMTKRLKYIEQFLAELFTDRDEFAIRFLAKVFLHFKMDFTPVPVISDAEANQIKTPITLLGAKHDILFPGEKMIDRAVKIFPSLKKSVLLENSKHVQNRKDNTFIEHLILENKASPVH